VADSPVQLSPAELRAGQRESFYSIRELVGVLRRRRGIFLSVVAGLCALCVLYCLIAPNQYEAEAKVALRMQPVSSLAMEAVETVAPASILSTPLQLETLAMELRSERLAWRVITELRLYESTAFVRNFAGRFPEFDATRPTAAAQGYLLDRFLKRLKVRSAPRTLLVEIRFRDKDAAESARVVNALIAGFMAQEGESRVDATGAASGWLQRQLTALTAQAELKEKRLAEFERQHGFMTSQQTVQGGAAVETLHDSTIQEVDETERQLTEASGERILREALYEQAKQGDPEQVLAANPEMQAAMSAGGAALVEQLRTRLSEVGVELAQLRAEHGMNFPRVVELARAQGEIQEQIKAADSTLLEGFERTWKAAQGREQMLQKELDARMAEGLKENEATIQYAVLRDEVVSERELCSRVRRRIEEAGLSAGVRASSITVVDSAREPYKPVAPDLPLYLAITLFASVWLGMGGALLVDALKPDALRPDGSAEKNGRVGGAVVCLFLMLGAGAGYGQAPTPNTQGLPSGVVKLPQDMPLTLQPDAKTAPAVWNAAGPNAANAQEPTAQAARFAGTSMALPISAGDFVEVNEFHTAEFHSAVRVAADGTVMLPLVGQVKLVGLSEQEAAKAIGKALMDRGMLLHPQVSVLVTNAVGQDVSVMGEVTRPGVYPYTVHHRLLDLISAASGLSPNAGRLVSVFHRDDPKTGHAVVLDSSGTDTKVEHNPELEPGDTVLVSRAGLVYVIGDVIRPGGFAVDPVQGLTVVQALSLAWGATPNASATKAILIRDQAGGRTLTTLNLRRMIRGQDPDEPVRDRDILFVPDSAAKNLMNKSLESAIQSAIGVSIYAGLVYSQRF